jgi:hypothetical protein
MSQLAYRPIGANQAIPFPSCDAACPAAIKVFTANLNNNAWDIRIPALNQQEISH